MRIFFVILIFVFAAGFIAYDYFNLAFWMTPPPARLTHMWQEQIDHVKDKSKKISKELQLLNSIEMTVTDPQFVGFLDAVKKPYVKSAKGVYALHVEIMPSIDEMKYGFDIQNEIFDTRDNNKVDEFGFTITVGRLW